jgi:branched-chain amino acid transport system ATP-binding protein
VTIDSVDVEYVTGTKALSGASCTFQPGVMNGLIGPNGAGKTTLLNAVSGAVPRRSGTIHVGDIETRGLRPEQVRHLGVTRTYQIPRLYPALSVVDNVALGLLPPTPSFPLWAPWRTSSTLRQRRSVAAEWLAELGFEDLGAARVRDLTLPQQRIVELARALISKPGLVMLDEPSAGLGVDEAASILRHAQSALAGTTVVLISHDVEFVFEFVEWVVVMAQGAVLAEGVPAAIRADARVIDAYLGSAA